MIQFNDFISQIKNKGGLFKSDELETMADVLDRVNSWQQDQQIDIINIETVVLPNIYKDREKGSAEMSIYQDGDSINYWNQFIRVWYKKK
jgi:NAD(P)H-nitrite reductase large subunit